MNFSTALKVQVTVWLALVTEMQVELMCVIFRWKFMRQCEKSLFFPLSQQPETFWMVETLSAWVSEGGDAEQNSPPALVGVFAWMRNKPLFLKSSKTEGFFSHYLHDLFLKQHVINLKEKNKGRPQWLTLSLFIQ